MVAQYIQLSHDPCDMPKAQEPRSHDAIKIYKVHKTKMINPKYICLMSMINRVKVSDHHLTKWQKKIVHHG